MEAARGLRACGDPAAAAAALETALTHAPRSIGLLEALATAYIEAGARDQAAGAMARIAAVWEGNAAATPDDPEPCFNLGAARVRLSQWAAAAAALRLALARDPAFIGAHHLLGSALLKGSRPSEAAEALRAAARLNPGSAAILVDLGLAEKASGDAAAAEAAARDALRLAPNDSSAHALLAESIARAQTATTTLLDQAMEADNKGIFALARENYRTVLHREPGHVYALSRLLTLDGFEGRMDRAEVHHQMLVDSLERADLDSISWEYLAVAARLHAVRPLPQPLYAAITRALDRQLVAAAKPRTVSPIASEGRRLKIGYLSGLFRDNPVGHVTAALFAAHDRARFDVHVFYVPEVSTPNLYTEAIKKGAEHFIPLQGTPREMADTIAAHGLDVLVFIGGFTEHSLLPVIAARPAPVQVFWLGHAGNCDISAIDYFLADATVVPPGEEGLYTAKVARLPAAYHCASPHRIGGPLSRADVGLPEEGFVFCAFNNTEKIDRRVFGIWMKILKRVDGSILWLSRGLSPAVEDNLRAAATAAGVDATRLFFAARLPDKAEHLARHRLCGLFLDTLLINAHTTALDALWSGLPLLTVEGARFGSRFGAMALRTLGLEDMIMPTTAAYEDRAVYLATHPAALEDLRGRLAGNLYTAPLFRTDLFCRDLEDCLERLHHAALA